MTDSEGLQRAYNEDKKVYVDGNKLYVAGTSNLRDVWDDLKIPLKLTRYSQRYKDADEVLKSNPQVESITGHSLGGAVSLELNKNNNNKYKISTYGAPVFQWGNQKSDNVRFRHPGDIVSMFDNGAIPVTNNILKNTVSPITNHTFEQYMDTGKESSTSLNPQIM